MKPFRKHWIPASGGLILLICLMSCTTTVKYNNVKITHNKERVTLWYEAFNTKNVKLLESILDEQWADLPADSENPVGKKQVGTLMTLLTTVFPDFNCEIQDVLEDGNKVIVRSTITGKQTGAFKGLAPKNKSMAIQAVDIHEFKDGLIIKTWHTEDWLTGLGQLGHLP